MHQRESGILGASPKVAEFVLGVVESQRLDPDMEESVLSVLASFLHHEYEPLKEEGSRKGHTHRSSWKGGQSSLHPGRLPPAYRAGAEPRRGQLIWRCCGRESKKSHGRAAGTRLGPLTNKQKVFSLRVKLRTERLPPHTTILFSEMR